MATSIPTTNVTTGINVAGPSFVYVRDGLLVSNTTGPGINADAGKSSITVEGEVTAVTQAGVQTGAAAEGFGNGNSLLTVGANGMVTGTGSAVAMAGIGNVVNNHGLIAEIGTPSSNGTGISFFGQGGDGKGGGNTVNNDGIITGSLFGLHFQNSDIIKDNIVNNNGTISALQTAIQFEDGFAGVVNKVVNSGIIDGGNFALIGTDFEEALFNTGSVSGGVRMGGGTDTVHNVGGTIGGFIDMGAGNDFFTGGDSSERVQGDAGDDLINLGGGDDTYVAGRTTQDANDGKDEIDGGAAGERGNTFDAAFVSNSLNISLGDSRAFGSAIGFDTIHNFQNVIGSTAADVIEGDGAANRLQGGGGADTIGGGAGGDRINGGTGADGITGGLGRDVLTGASNADTFIFGGTLGAYDSGLGAGNRDVITDFTQGNDIIDLSAIDANANTVTNNVFAFIGNGAFTNVAGQLRAVENASGKATVIEADTNGDGAADFQITLHGTIGLVAGDFVL